MDSPRPSLTEQMAEFARSERGRRTIGVTVTLAIEGLLLLALLTLGITDEREPVPMADVTTFDVRDAAPPEPEPQPEPEPPVVPSAPQQAAQAALPVAAPMPPPAAVIPVQPTPAPPEVQRPVTGPRPITAPPPGAPVYGPAAPPRPRDSVRVGTAPGGQPLYAASWYRRPRDDEMRGYLSTAQPGYATISCRTVPDYRVEDCVLENEWPSGSQMGRAVLAMAWQFRVRPPMLGGRYQVGEWVRIRITYTVREEFEF